MQINPLMFREFSIRGIADQDLTDNVVQRIGQAAGFYFGVQGLQTIAVGRDVRLSSPRIAAALSQGLLQAGRDLIDVGTVPTPVLNFSTDRYGADGGIMITASHNPPDYNGLKLRASSTLQGDDLQEILRLAQADESLVATPGTLKQIDPIPDYSEQVRRLADLAGRELNVVIDGGNGTNGQIVAQILRDLGCSVHEIYCEPDGAFPNRKPDPTAAGATEALAAAVIKHRAHLGVAYDGDGDRLVAVDNLGNTVFGDQLLMLLARDLLRHGQTHIVYEILCTQALADDVLAHGGIPVMTPSGYAFIHDAMQKTGAALGGEMSGHMFCNEPGFRFDDAILATIKLLNHLSRQSAPLSELVAALPSYHSSPEIRLPCPDEAKAGVVESIRAHYRDQYKVEEIDGARIHFPGGWALVRQSNTQPVMSMRFEARSAGELADIQSEVQSLVETTIAAI